MKSFFNSLSFRFPFFANRPSALERAVRTSPKSRRLRMEPLENRALLAVDAFGGAASSIDSDVGATWGPDPAPAFSASVLATDAAVIDLSAVDATLAETTFSVQNETPEPVAPPSFEQLMEALGQVKIESLDDESDVASASYLDVATAPTQPPETQAEARHVVFYDSSAADFDASTLNLDDESVYYVDAANANAGDTESYSVTPRSGGNSSDSDGSGGSSNSGGTSSSGGSNAGTSNGGYLTTYGSSTIHESATFTGSGGSDQGPYFGFTTPAIPSGCWAYVRFEGGDAEYGKDYVVRCATIDENGVVTPNMNYVSGGAAPNNAYDIYVYGPATYCVVPLNDNDWEQPEDVVATLYFDMLSGGSDVDPPPVAYDSFTATIIDDDATFSVYWDNGLANRLDSATLSGNPNGGGVRVFPELANSSDAQIKRCITLRFKLNNTSNQPQTIHYKLCDPDNFISLGKGQLTDGNYAPNDNNQTLPLKKRRLDELEFSDFLIDQTLSLTFQPNETEKTIVCMFQQAYAGDNFIVVAGQNQELVEAAQLGTTAKERYEVVQPTGATPATKLRQTQNLTVWRTLRAELDSLTVGGETADAPLIDDFVTSELSRACVDLKAYSPNNSPNISSLAQEITKSYMQSLAPLNRDASSNPWFWSTRLIGAFSININGILGNYENSNTIFVYNDTHETFVSEWNELHSTNFDVNVLKRRTALHEIGHALSLEHAESTVMLIGNPSQLTSLDVLLSPVNLIFSDTQLAQIQSLIEPTAPRSALETD